jgi:hypothetical protein
LSTKRSTRRKCFCAKCKQATQGLFIHWLVCFKSNSKNVDHYLDDFFFAGEAGTNNCTNLMNQFDGACERLGVPIAY